MLRQLFAFTIVLVLAVPLVPGSLATTSDLPLFARPRPINRVAEDPWLGGTWLGSDIGLVLLEPGAPPQQVSFRQGLPAPKVNDIAVTRDRVWISTAAGAAVYNKADGSVREVLGPDGSPLRDESRVIFVEPDAVWVGTTNKGLFRADPTSLRATAINNPVNQSAFRHPIMGLGSDGQELFISATGYGLVDWHRDTGQATHYAQNILVARPVYGRLLVTPSRVWVGTAGDGAVFLDRARDAMGEYAEARTLNARVVFGLAQIGQETWFGTDGGISRYDGATDTWSSWQSLPWGYAADVAIVGGNVVAAMTKGALIQYDRVIGGWVDISAWTAQTAIGYNTVPGCDTVDGKLLFGTGGDGASFYDPSNHQWQKIDAEGANLPDILIWGSTSDATHTWFASQHGAARWDRSTNQWLYLRTDGRPHGVLAANAVHQVAPTGDGVWLATQSVFPPTMYKKEGWQKGSLAHWQESTASMTLYQQAQGLANDNVTQVALTPGKAWAGMLTGGLDVLDLASDHISHVYPTDGTNDSVESLLVQDGTLWMGTHKGLWKVDVSTLAVTNVPGSQDFTVLSLAAAHDRVWAGTAGAGVFSVDPSGGGLTTYRAPSLSDVWAYCLLAQDDILYAGTGGGIERLDLARGTWLPQMGPSVLERAPTSPTVVSIRITSPSEGAQAPAGSIMKVQGTGQGPAGSAVEVRLGAGPWTLMEGVDSWQGQILLPNAAQQVTVDARLVAGGATLAQTARVLSILAAGADSTAQAGVAQQAVHFPPLEATEGQSPVLQVAASDPGNATGHVVFYLPGASSPVLLPLQPGPGGNLTVQTPRLTPAGLAHYHIEISWGSFGMVLPDPYSGYGPDYSLAVRPASSLRALASNVACPGTLAPGGDATISASLQNTGTRAFNLSLEFSGTAETWATAPAAMRVEPAESWLASIAVHVPRDAKSGDYPLTGALRAADGTLDSLTCVLHVDAQGQAATRGSGTGIPAPGGFTVALLVALATAWSRRKGRC